MSDVAPAFRVRVAATLSGLELARLQMRQFLDSCGQDAEDVAAFELVLEESVTNTLRYGYDVTGLRWIDVGVVLLPEALELTLEDDGRPFDPLSVPEPELPQTLDAAKVGGLGLLMIRRTAQRLDYERVSGHNRLCVRIARRANAARDRPPAPAA